MSRQASSVRADVKAGLRLLLVGASGAVGRAVLERALADSRIAEVVAQHQAPVRRY